MTTPPPPAATPKYTISKTLQRNGQRVVVYGGGGKGKTSLCASAKDPVFVFLGGERAPIDVPNIPGIKTYEQLLDLLRTESVWRNVGTIVVDSATVAEAMAVDYTIRNVKTEKGVTVQNIEGYGFGKGYRHVCDSFRLLLSALDRHAEQGRHVILTVHETVDATPNPAGDDYKSSQPNLMQKGEAKLRDLTRDWCDHMLYIGYDIAVDGGKGKSSGSRCIFTQERATHWAKCRADPAKPVPYCIPYPIGDDAIWQYLGMK